MHWNEITLKNKVSPVGWRSSGNKGALYPCWCCGDSWVRYNVRRGRRRHTRGRDKWQTLRSHRGRSIREM